MAGPTKPDALDNEELPTLEELFASIEANREMRGSFSIADVVEIIREDREAGHDDVL